MHALPWASVNILLLQLKRIGDLILTTPAINAVRKEIPEARITLAIANECRELAPAIPNVTRFLMVRRNWRDIPVFLAVGLHRFEFCVDFTRNDRSAVLAYLSRAKKRVAAHRPHGEPEARTRVYTDFTERMGSLHTVDYHLALLRPLGIENPSTKLHLNIPSAARDKAQTLLRQAKIDNQFAVLHPGAARAEKFWEIERWVEVINRARPKIDIVLTGTRSPFEQEHLQRIRTKLREPIVDLSGRTDLLTFAALIAQARLLVTVDSAAMHLAAATQTPQIVLFGPTNPFHWRPRESPALILQGGSKNPVNEFESRRERLPMKQISTEAVINAMDCLLSAPAAARIS
jgi:predicted lipopolysaccharide heptosyltransferase III